ncbi:glycosyltransferase [Acidobacteriota bacterium]
MIKVTVIICTYNEEKELSKCLNSIQNQDYGELELIIVDDASVDGTSDCIERFRDRTNLNTIVLTNDVNLGVAGSRNAGIQYASGDIIAFTDADCIADKSWISELVRGYRQEDVAAVGGSIKNIPSKNVWELLDKRHNFVAHHEGLVPYIQGCNMSFYTKVLKQYLFNSEIKYGYEETLLCDQLVEEGYEIWFRPQALVQHKARNSLAALMKLKYRRGVSSVWYFRKRIKFIIFKRHLVLLFGVLCLPFFIVSSLFVYPVLISFLLFGSILVHDEFIFRTKNNREILTTFPFLLFIEFAHFAGSLAGLVKFWLLKRPNKD